MEYGVNFALRIPHSALRIMKISVVIPTLNEAARIGALLSALRAQDYAALEIIVCDGGSDDGTPDIARSFGVRVLESSPAGTARQRNAGAVASGADLLMFMDADDLPHPQFVSQVARSYRRLPFAVACPWFVARDAGFAVRLIYCGFNVLFFMAQSWLRMGSGVCIVTPRRVFERVGGFDEELHLGEDIRYLHRAAPRFGLHRHLLVPLETSGRRFRQKGAWNLVKFYARIAPLLWLGRWEKLKGTAYEAAPYKDSQH